MKEEGVVASGVALPATVPGVLGEAGASSGAREALEKAGRASGGAPCLGHRAHESRKAAACHAAAGVMQHEAEQGTGAKVKTLMCPERGVGEQGAADMMGLPTVPSQSPSSVT